MKKIKPELFFTIVILFFGLILIFITPIGAGFDEDTHLGRIWEMSKGVIIPNQYLSQGPYYPYAFYQLSYRQDVNLKPVSWDEWQQQMTVHIDWDNMINHKTRAIYFPSLYIIQAFLMGIMGRLLDTPVAIMYYVLRFSYLVTFALFTFLAIRIIPIGKWILGLLSILPMSLIQASSISPDALNNGFCFLFFAWVLYLNKNATRNYFSKKDWIVTLLFVIGISTLKLNSIFLLLLLLLIPPIKYGSKKWMAAFVFVTLLAVFVFFVGWNWLTSSELTVISTGETSPMHQIQGMISDPSHFINAIIYNLQTQYLRYFIEWVGVSGYAYWQMPALLYGLVPLLLLFSLLGESTESLILSIKQRLWLMLIFVVTSLGTITIFYLIYNPPDSILIPGVQGRYFIFAVPLLLFAVIPVRQVLKSVKTWIGIGSILVALIGTLALFAVYHLTCGSSLFSTGLCYLPQYKNWSPQTSLPLSLNSSTVVKQTLTSDCQNLNQIRLWVPAHEQKMNAEIYVKLFDALQDKVMASTKFEPSLLPASGWLYFNFPPLADSIGKAYLLEITAGQSENNQNIQFAYSKTNEYRDGSLSINMQDLSGDLLFQYGCRTGLSNLFGVTGP